MLRRSLLAALLVGLLGHGAAPAQTRPHVLAIWHDQSVSKQEFAQLQNMLRIVAQAFSSTRNTPVAVKMFPNKDAAEAAVMRGEVDIMLNNSSVAREKGFKPFAAYGLFNEPTPRECVYVNKGSAYDSLRSLKGKPFATRRDSGVRYTRLGLMLRANPGAFFKPLKGAKNDGSLAYMLSLGEADGALINVWAVGLMTLTNPGPVKKLRRLECNFVCPSYVMASPRVPPATRTSFMKFMTNVRQEKSLARYWATIKSVGLVFAPYDDATDKKCKAREAAMEKTPGVAPWSGEFEVWNSLEQKRVGENIPNE